MKKTLLQIAPYLAIIILIGFMLFNSYERRIEDDLAEARAKESKIELKRLEDQALIKDQQIVSLEFDKSELQKIIGSINRQLEIINQEKANLIKKRDEKINTISNYNSVQLQQFFADNYPE